jgi:hypothetical protein
MVFSALYIGIITEIFGILLLVFGEVILMKISLFSALNLAKGQFLFQNFFGSKGCISAVIFSPKLLSNRASSSSVLLIWFFTSANFFYR